MLNRSKWKLYNISQICGILLYSTEALASSSSSSRADSLYYRICRAGEPTKSMTVVLDQWVEEGRDVNKPELQKLIKELRKFHRYRHALQISEWMSNEMNHDLSTGDIAIRLDLISKVHGLQQAESYFSGIPDSKREFRVCCALLNSYATHKSLKEAEAMMWKIKQHQYGCFDLSVPYGVMLKLYAEMHEYEKLDHLMQEMKEKDIFSRYIFGIRLNAYVTASDVEGMKKLMMQMEADPLVTMDWYMYSTAAKGYLKAGQVEKATAMLKKSEYSIRGNMKRTAYESLLTMYAAVGNKDEVYRVWNMYKKLGRFHNSAYICMLSSLEKLDDIDGAERILEEWESGHTCFDNRIPKLMITAYCKKGLLEKAEAYIRRLLESGKEVRGDAWDRLAIGYRVHNDMEKAVQAMKKAILGNQPERKPNLFTLATCIDYAKEREDLELALEILMLFREHGHLSEATYGRLLSYVHNEAPNTNALGLIKGYYQLEENDVVPEGEKWGIGDEREQRPSYMQ